MIFYARRSFPSLIVSRELGCDRVCRIRRAGSKGGYQHARPAGRAVEVGTYDNGYSK